MGVASDCRSIGGPLTSCFFAPFREELVDHIAPLGGPTPSRVTDPFISTVLLPVPVDYKANWPAYKVRAQVGSRALTQAVPKPE
jgi:hypothetical protein